MDAQAVWRGTRFLASPEANAHAEYQRCVLEAAVDDTVRTTLFDAEWPGQPMRVLMARADRLLDDLADAGRQRLRRRFRFDAVRCSLSSDHVLPRTTIS